MNIDELLSELHISTVECLLDRVKSGEATAQELSVACKLLKDNGIDSSLTGDTPITQLAVAMPFEDPEAPASQVG
jgi:Trm5-related predicted tRNA methylase